VTYFDEEWAKARHLELVAEAPSSAMALTVHFRVAASQLEIGPATLPLKNTGCVNLSAQSQLYGVPIAGVIGSDFLFEHAVRIRYDVGVVELAAVKHPAIPPKSALIPVMAKPYGAYFTVLLRQEPSPPVGASAMIDTGFVGGLMVSDKLASRAEFKPIDGAGTDMLGALGVRRMRSVEPLLLTLGTATFEKVPTFVADSEPPRDALIGTDILSLYVLVIDYPNGLLVLSLRESHRGFGFTISVPVPGGDVRIHDVFHGSHAEQDGLKVADVLAAVNGQVVGHGEMSDAINAIAAAEKQGDALVLRIRRRDETLEIKTRFEDKDWVPPRLP
jgi:predicted aspartyl protease